MAENKMEMDPEVLRTTARKVETSAGDVRKELKRFTSVIEGLSSTWSSEVKDRFLQNYQKDRAALLEMPWSVPEAFTTCGYFSSQASITGVSVFPPPKRKMRQ